MLEGNNRRALLVLRTFLPRLLLVCAILTLNSAATFARDDARIYRCSAKEGVLIREDGTLDKFVGEIAKKHFDKVVIGIPDGHVTLSSRGIRQECVVEQTSEKSGSDFVLYPKSSRRIGHTVANAVTHFIRLRAAADDPQPRFMAVTLSYIATGTCEIVP